MSDAPNKIVTPPSSTASSHEKIEAIGAWLEAFYSLLLCAGCGVVLCLMLCAYCSSDEPGGTILVRFAKTMHENWRASLILLFPTMRATWRRIEPRLQKLVNVVELSPAPQPTNHEDSQLPQTPNQTPKTS